MAQSPPKNAHAIASVAEITVPRTVNLRNLYSLDRLCAISAQTDFLTNMEQKPLKCEGRKFWNTDLFSSV